MLKTRVRKVVCIVLSLVTILSMFAMSMNVSAATVDEDSIKNYRIWNISKYSKVEKADVKFGRWNVYGHSAWIKWKAVPDADGYEIKWKSASWEDEKATVKNTTFHFSGYAMHGIGAQLKMPEYYKVQVRAYVTVKGKKHYSKWSMPTTVWC